MKKFVKSVERILNLFPISLKDKIYEIALFYIPIRILKLIPCSYSAYLKCYEPARGDIVMDCGAHIGNCSLLFSRLVKDEGLVIAVEPVEDSFHSLKKKIERLNIKNVTLVNKGLWNSDEKLLVRIVPGTGMVVFVKDKPPDAAGQSRTGSQQEREIEENYLWIDGIKLDSLVKKLGPDRLDFIKMDIEGIEIEALEGAQETIMKYSPHFAIASYHIRDKKKTFFQVEGFLEERGYSVRTFFEPHLTTCARRKTDSSA